MKTRNVIEQEKWGDSWESASSWTLTWQDFYYKSFKINQFFSDPEIFQTLHYDQEQDRYLKQNFMFTGFSPLEMENYFKNGHF